MGQPIPSQIEESFSQLSISEQLRVIEHLVRRVHERSRNRAILIFSLRQSNANAELDQLF